MICLKQTKVTEWIISGNPEQYNVVDAFHVGMNGYVGEQLDKLKEEGLITGWQLFDATTDPAIQPT